MSENPSNPVWRPRLIISGGQTGVDQAGLRVGLELGIPIGGTAPLGFKTEDRKIPRELRVFMKQAKTDDYPERTRINVAESDATLLFIETPRRTASQGSRLTMDCCLDLGRPCLVRTVNDHALDHLEQIHEWLAHLRPGILNIAGSRASRAPKLAGRVRSILLEVWG